MDSVRKNRPSRLETLIEIADIVSRRGTCSRLQVGAVIHSEGRILTTGYNGAPSGVDHCIHEAYRIGNVPVPEWASKAMKEGPIADNGQVGGWLDYNGTNITYTYPSHKSQPCIIAAHAERNAIDWAARLGIALHGSELVTTDTPCSQCAGSIINAGITSVVAVRPYRDQTGVRMLEQAGVSMILARDVR